MPTYTWPIFSLCPLHHAEFYMRPLDAHAPHILPGPPHLSIAHARMPHAAYGHAPLCILQQDLCGPPADCLPRASKLRWCATWAQARCPQ